MIKFLKFIPIQLTFCLVIGILFGHYFIIDPIFIYIFLGFLVLIFFGIYNYANSRFEPTLLFTTVTFLLAFFIGVAAITFKNDQNQKLFYANQDEFSIEKQHAAVLRIYKILKPTNFSNKYEAEIVQLNSKKAIGTILVNIQKDSVLNLLRVDDEIFVKTLFHEISNPKNPYEFNYKNYLKNQQIHYQIHLENSQFLVLDKARTTLIGLAENSRALINLSLIKNGFKDDELGVINALLLGQRQNISEELMQSYSGAGAIHILAVSGLHVGIILLILTFLFKPLHYFKNGKLLASVCIVISLWMFAILAGLSASVVRAVTMFTAISIGMYSNRSTNVYNTLVISMFVLLLVNPYYLFEVGFQLSYLAVFSIVWIQPKIYGLFKPKLWIGDKFWQLFSISVAAQIGVLPLSLFYFHQFPGLFFVTNLVIIPFLGFILIFGIIVMLFAVFDLLPQFLSDGYIFVIQQMNNFISWVSNQEFFIIQHITFSFALLLVFYVFILVVFKWTEKMNFQRIVLVFLSIIFIQIVFIFEKYQLQNSQNFIVFNKSQESIIGNRIGEKLKINTSISNFSLNENPIKNYLVGTGIDSVSMSDKNNNLQIFRNESILIIDSLGIYKFNSIQPTIVVLRQSPKINLDRLLNSFQPRLIVADGSNYKSYVSKWEESCIKNKTPFHSTMQNGAFILK